MAGKETPSWNLIADAFPDFTFDNDTGAEAVIDVFGARA